MHIFTADMQPAHNYVVRDFDKPHRIKCSKHALKHCYGCGKRRRAKNLRVQAFYDGPRFWCREGCK